jgi:hypothetical protein
MHAQFDGANGAQLVLDIPFEDFLSTGPMFRQAQAAMCDPEDLIGDYVHEEAARYGDDDEIGQAFGEAAMLASDRAVHNVELDAADIAFVRQRFGRNRGFALVDRGIPPLVA